MNNTLASLRPINTYDLMGPVTDIFVAIWALTIKTTGATNIRGSGDTNRAVTACSTMSHLPLAIVTFHFIHCFRFFPFVKMAFTALTYIFELTKTLVLNRDQALL